MAATNVSKEEVEHIAKLTNLTLNDKEVAQLSLMFTDTLDYMNILSELDTNEVSETFQVTGLTNVFQKDSDKPTTLSQKEALSNASENIDNLFSTTGVFTE